MAMTQDTIKNIKAAHPNIQWANYSEVTQDHQEIGWVQILYVHFVAAWITTQQSYEQKTGKGYSADPKWMRRLIQEIWVFAAKCWAFGNKELIGEGGDEV
eukprot:1617600-Ditylum_brightwellii.AAC.1